MILGAVVEVVALELQNGDSGMGRQQAQIKGKPTVELSKSVGPNNQTVPNTHACMNTIIILYTCSSVSHRERPTITHVYTCMCTYQTVQGGKHVDKK